MTLALLALIAALAAAPEDQRCASGDRVAFTPAEMLAKAQAFRAALSAVERRRLDEALPRGADGRVAACAGRDGASCAAAASLHAFGRLGLMAPFLATLCPHPTS